MTRKIALITEMDLMKEIYGKELKEVFSGRLDIEGYSLECDMEKIRSELANIEILVITASDLYPVVKEYAKKDCRFIHLHYSFLRSKIEALKQLPEGTDAVICFNFIDISIEIMSLLYEARVSNLNLFVQGFNDRGREGQSYDVALIAEYDPLEMPKAETYFEMGRRKLSFSSVIEIALATEILDEELEQRIFRYCAPSVNLSNYVKGIYDTSSYTRVQLQTIMDCIDYAILIFDSDYRIKNYNMHINELFHIREGDILLERSVVQIPEMQDIREIVQREEDFTNELMEWRNRNIVISKKKITKELEEQINFIVLMKDVTELTNLENSLRRKMMKKGHIARYHFSDIIGDSQVMRSCVAKAAAIAKIDKPTLITGESGTGKELFAQAIHNASHRSRYPFIGINCAAIPEQLLESELFGYAEGSFTGAKKGGKAGLFEQAHKGTLFLDEIGEISPATQAKLLRVLEEKEVMKVGSDEILSVDVRVITATNQNLRELIDQGKFRRDLYYRINNIVIKVPPVRSRREDIPQLIRYFMKKEGCVDAVLDEDVERFLVRFDWEGNVRELRNCVEYMAHISDGRIGREHLPEYISEEAGESVGFVGEETEVLPAAQRARADRLLFLIASEGGGRRSLKKKLEEENETASEYEVRKLIGLLQKNGLVTCRRGRGGISVTRHGWKYLEKMNLAAQKP